MVEASTSTISSLLVSFRNGVGILTFLAINQSGRHGGEFFRGQQGLKFTQAGLDLPRMTSVAADGIERLQTISRDTEHNRIFGRNLPSGNQFLCHPNGDAAGGFG